MDWIELVKLFVVLLPTLLMLVPFLYILNWLKTDLARIDQILSSHIMETKDHRISSDKLINDLVTRYIETNKKIDTLSKEIDRLFDFLSKK